MNRPWAVRIARTQIEQVARLRLLANLLVLVEDDAFWLRGPNLSEDLDVALRSLLGAERFQVKHDRQLVPVGCQVPRGRLPKGNWLPIKQCFPVSLPRTVLPGNLTAGPREPIGLSLRLVRSKSATVDAWSASLLLVRLSVWNPFASCASRVRLQPLSFTANEHGDVLVRGSPVPPLPGIRFRIRENVALPIGWCWSPDVDAPAVRQVLSVSEDQLAVVMPDGAWQLLSTADFVAATRSAVRLTTAKLVGEPPSQTD